MAEETIYKIQLNNSKFYVGRTKIYNHRMDDHLTGAGAQWVKKYGFVECTSLMKVSSNIPGHETKETLTLMLRHGLNNVRGAEYCQLADFVADDCKRMSFAIVHHLDCGLNPADVEATLRRSIGGGSGAGAGTSPVSASTSPYSGQKRARSVGETAYTEVKESSLHPASYTDSTLKIDLFTELCALRKAISISEGVPPFYVFSDATLEEMASVKPTTTAAFNKLHGVGPVKSAQYGPRFLSTIRAAGDTRAQQRQTYQPAVAPYQAYLPARAQQHSSPSGKRPGQACAMCRKSIPWDPAKPVCYDCYKRI